MKHYIEVDATKELPDKPGRYHTGMGLVYYKHPKWEGHRITDWTWEYEGCGFFIENSEVGFWLKPISLSELITEEEMADIIYQEWYSLEIGRGMRVESRLLAELIGDLSEKAAKAIINHIEGKEER